MKLLIVSAPRVGGRILSKWLSLELNHMWIHEPLNIKGKRNSGITIEGALKLLDTKDIVVKCNIGDLETTIPYDELISKVEFDKVITLTREDTFDAAVSLSHAIIIDNYTQPYNMKTNWVDDNLHTVRYHEKNMVRWMNEIKKIKNSLEITYEGVYLNGSDVEKIKEYLNIKEFKYTRLLDKEHRYRNNKLI
jgi:hypothetical protein